MLARNEPYNFTHLAFRIMRRQPGKSFPVHFFIFCKHRCVVQRGFFRFAKKGLPEIGQKGREVFAGNLKMINAKFKKKSK